MLSAILFDLDGTIVNTDPIHYLCWQEMLRKYKIEIDEKFYQARISGRLNPEIVKDILSQLSAGEQVKFAEDKEALFRRKAVNLQPLPGFSELLAWAKKHNLKCALVTNAPRKNAEFMLEILGIKAVFDTIVLAEDCTAGKPNPEPYLVTLKNLAIEAENAIVLEDSPSGIRSAVGAKISTIGVASTHDPQVLYEVGAFIVISDFTDLQLWKILHQELGDRIH